MEQLNSLCGQCNHFGGHRGGHNCPVQDTLQPILSKPGKRYETGKRIFEQSSDASHIYYINSGFVQLSQIVDGSPLVVQRLGAGKFIGMEAIYPYGYYIATAQTMRSSKLTKIPKSVFEDIFKVCPMAMISFISMICDEIRIAEETLHPEPKQELPFDYPIAA